MRAPLAPQTPELSSPLFTRLLQGGKCGSGEPEGPGQGAGAGGVHPGV